MQAIRRLDFDSDLFGYEVGEVSVSNTTDLSSILSDNSGYRLVYVVSHEPLTIHGNHMQNLKLADVKVTWFKELHKQESQVYMSIGRYRGNEGHQLRALAMQSGVFSRFNTDDNFKDSEYSKLYSIWIEKIMRYELADEIFIYEELPEILGFVSVKRYNDVARIGLIAVDEKARGKSVATGLMNTAEEWAMNGGIRGMLVSTQQVNHAAMQFYQSLGYKESGREYIYHYWHF